MRQYVEDSVVEMLNGCICCTVRADLSEVLKKFLKNDKLKDMDGVIIETTGLADPSPVASTFFMDEEIENNYRLDGIITVVDSKNIIHQLDRKMENDAENEAYEQLVFANKVILNKIDLLDNQTEDIKMIKERIKEINPFVSIFPTSFSKMNISEVLNIKAFNLESLDEDLQQELRNADEASHNHDLSVKSTSVVIDGEMV